MRARFTLMLFTIVAVLTGSVQVAHLDTLAGNASPFRYTGDGKIALTDPNTGESISVAYRNGDGEYQDAALDAIDYTLRCHGKGETFPLSLKLVELVDHLQDHFGSDHVYVVSGYRSPEYNASIQRKIWRVAHNSRHMQGQAMDILIEGVSKQQLVAYARTLRSGGVGDYFDSSYVHVDVGPVKNW